MKITGINQAITADSEAVPKRYGETLGKKLKNLVFVGNFDTNPWQRATSFTSPSSGDYTADRFRHLINSGAGFNHSVSRATDSPTLAESGNLGTYCYQITDTSSGFSISSSNVFFLQHPIEGHLWKQLHQKACTLSFWVKSSKTGTYSISLTNNGVNRGFIKSYTINVANTWEKKVLQIPASPSDGTWGNFTTDMSFFLNFMLMAGSSRQASEMTDWGTISTTNAVTGQTNFFDNTSGTFKLAYIQLESGTSATEFEKLPIQEIETLAKRYYNRMWSIPSGGTAYVAAGRITSATVADFIIRYPVPMRVAPSVTISSGFQHFVVDKAPSAGVFVSTLDSSSFVTTESCRVLTTGLSGETAGRGCNLGIYNGSISFSAD